MPPIRILLVGPPLFAELIERLLATSTDAVIVGTVPDGGDLMQAARARNADAIVLRATDDAPAESFDAALYEFPTVKLVALAPDRKTAMLLDLRPHHTPLRDLSRDRLLDAIRTAVAATAAGHAPP